MARLIWTEPTLADLDAIAEYIALDNPAAARRLMADILTATERLEKYPHAGKHVKELPRSIYRELIIPPCRVFYRPDKTDIYVLHVMRGEQLFRMFLLEENNRVK